MNVREIIYFILLVILVGCGVFGISRVKSWYDAAQQNKQAQRTLQTTSGLVEDGLHADRNRASRDQGLANAREDFNRRYNEDRRNDPEIASRADRVVPQRVRDNFHTRRIARERLGCAGEQCGKGPEDNSTSER